VSPIYVRPAREQSEHDRLIRHLQTKYQKKFEVAANIDGVEPATFVKIGPATLAPDLVLVDGKKLVGLVEVETGESINNLEAMAQWVHFSHARVPFHLYVPVHGYEATRRLCESYSARIGELWTYRPTHDGFDLVRMHADAAAASGTRGVKAVPVSIVVPVVPKPVPKPPEVPEPKPAPPAKVVAPVPAKLPVKTVAAAPVRPVPAAKPAAKPVAVPVAKPAAKPIVKPAPKPAPRPVKPVKAVHRAAAKPVKKVAKPAKTVGKAIKPKPAAKAVTKVKKPAAGRGKKAAPRRGR
jgi:hypothetical protein